MGNYTQNYQLHQWDAEDDFLRSDFNEDFAKIDTALGTAGREEVLLDFSPEEDTAQISLSLAGLDLSGYAALRLRAALIGDREGYGFLRLNGGSQSDGYYIKNLLSTNGTYWTSFAGELGIGASYQLRPFCEAVLYTEDTGLVCGEVRSFRQSYYYCGYFLCNNSYFNLQGLESIDLVTRDGVLLKPDSRVVLRGVKR